MSALTMVGVVAVVLLAAVVNTLSGFGFSLVAVPLLAAMLGGRDAVAVTSLVGTVTATALFLRTRHDVDRGVAGRQLAAAALGMPLGLAVLAVLDDRVLRLTIAAAVIVAVVLLVRGFRIERGGDLVDVGAGFLSGALNTSVGTSGPPLVFANQARGLGHLATRATLSAVFSGSSLLVIPLFAATGRYDHVVLSATVLASPALVVGWLVGLRLHPMIDPSRFRGLVLALLVASAAVAAASALA